MGMGDDVHGKGMARSADGIASMGMGGLGCWGMGGMGSVGASRHRVASRQEA